LNVLSHYSDGTTCGGAVSFVATPTYALSGTNCEWKVIATYKVRDLCGNETDVQTIEFNGGDTSIPTGTNINGNPNMNACFIDENTLPVGVPAFSTLIAAIRNVHSDNCTAQASLIVNHVSTVIVEGANCGWTVTHTYNVEDLCGNKTANKTVVYGGRSTTPPSGTPPAGTTNNNYCLADALENVPPFDPIAAAAGFTANCAFGNPVTATLTGTNLTGTNCAWTVTYTFSVTDKCNNTSTNRTIQHTGGNRTAPELTVPTTGLNLGCNPAQLPTVASVISASSATDNCGGTPTITAVAGNVTGTCDKSQTFTVTATDACSNTDVKTVTYTWIENHPVI
jgi:hypothetical protein